MKSRLPLIVLFLALSVVTNANAAPPPTQEACLADEVCRVHYETGREMSKADRYADALAAYDLAYKRLPVPLLLFNIGRLHQRADRPEQAAYFYQRYLAADGEAEPQRQRAQQLLDEVKAALDAQGKPLPDPNGPPPVVKSSAPPPVVVVQPPAPPPPKPVHKRWWFGTLLGVGGALLIGGAVAGAVVAVQSQTPSDLMRFEAIF